MNDKPATKGYYSGTGKTDYGYPTLEGTGAHELWHTGTLEHPLLGEMPNNLMHQSVRKNSGTEITKQQIIQMQEAYDKGELNKGRQCYD